MERPFREALRYFAMRLIGSRFTKPISRVALAACGLVLLAVIGRTAVAGALANSKPADATSARPPEPPESSAVPVTPPVAVDGAAPPPTPTARPDPGPTSSDTPQQGRVRASADDPVVLNSATEADLRRLPGIGPKRAEAILALRARLGRFHAVEDLLKVKGLGRATVKRLRPLLRVN